MPVALGSLHQADLLNIARQSNLSRFHAALAQLASQFFLRADFLGAHDLQNLTLAKAFIHERSGLALAAWPSARLLQPTRARPLVAPFRPPIRGSSFLRWD